MIENENKKRANRREFLQGGEPPLIGRARSSQKTSLHFVFYIFQSTCLFFYFPHSPYMIYFLSALNLYFLSPPSPYIFFLFPIASVYFF